MILPGGLAALTQQGPRTPEPPRDRREPTTPSQPTAEK